MRVSQHFALGLDQPSLDFVDVDIANDLRVFIDPRALRLLASDWAAECVSLVQSFFGTVLEAIRDGRHDEAIALLQQLREPNETHLGLSRGQSRGRALGPLSAREVWEALTNSEAAKTGLLEDLEDTILMIEGISSDIVSDITTNVIRGPLIRYTQVTCANYGIPMAAAVDSGPLWDPHARQWFSEYCQLPVTPTGKLILVPKVIVRLKMSYDAAEYYRHYLLEYLRDLELSSANSELVYLLKDGTRKVDFKSLREKYGQSKATIIQVTLQNTALLDQYRADKRSDPPGPLSHYDLAAQEETEQPNWPALLDSVTNLTPGREDSDAYEKNVEALLTALLYPYLTNPQPQKGIHQGRKRIDIVYTNAAVEGFFRWLSLHYPAAHIAVECKNYSRDLANPELDQIGGRFSPSRGRVGIVVCRSFDDKDKFLASCRDTATDDRGYILLLDDQDLRELVTTAADSLTPGDFPLLRRRFEALVM